MRAIVVVDVQNDFLPGGALAVPDGDAVVPIADGLLDRFDGVVATQDWHPADHLSFAAQHPGRAVGEVTEVDGLEQILWPVHCVEATPGAAFAAGLRTARFDGVFRKGTDRRTDSYSGFFDNGRRRSTGLEEWLRERGIDALWVLGLATDYCVKWTVLDACAAGFSTSLILDGCRGVELREGDVERAVGEMRAAGASIVVSTEVKRSERE